MMLWVFFSFFLFVIIIIDSIAFPMTLLTGLKGVRSAYYGICAASEVCVMGEKEGGSGKAAERRAREERKEERLERRIRRTARASQSEARSGAAEAGAAEPGARRSGEPSPGLSADRSCCAAVPRALGKSRLGFSQIKFLSTS